MLFFKLSAESADFSDYRSVPVDGDPLFYLRKNRLRSSLVRVLDLKFVVGLPEIAAAVEVYLSAVKPLHAAECSQRAEKPYVRNISRAADFFQFSAGKPKRLSVRAARMGGPDAFSPKGRSFRNFPAPALDFFAAKL